MRKRRIGWFLLGALVLVAGSTLVYYWIQSRALDNHPTPQATAGQTGPSLLAYLYPADASADLYLLDPSTGQITQLTDAAGALLDYSISQDGAAVYFNVSQEDGGTTLSVLERLTGKINTLLVCPQAACRYPQISPQGDYLAYERTELSTARKPDVPQVWLLPLSQPDRDGARHPAGDPRLVADPAHRTQQPQWTSKGRLTYYDFTLSAFVVQDPQSSDTIRFTSQTGIAGAWNPQGEQYVFPEIFASEVSDPKLLPTQEAVQSSHLLAYSLDGSLKDLTGVNNVEDSSPAFSPDGKMLAFGRKFLEPSHWTPGRQLWLMNADGSQGRAVTQQADYNHYDIAWSPDGAHIAYVRFNKDSLVDPPELWMMSSAGTGATRLVTGGYSPQWIP